MIISQMSLSQQLQSAEQTTTILSIMLNTIIIIYKHFHCFLALPSVCLSAVSKFSVLLLVSLSRRNLRRSSAAFLFTGNRTWLRREGVYAGDVGSSLHDGVTVNIHELGFCFDMDCLRTSRCYDTPTHSTTVSQKASITITAHIPKMRDSII